MRNHTKATSNTNQKLTLNSTLLYLREPSTKTMNIHSSHMPLNVSLRLSPFFKYLLFLKLANKS